MRDHVYFETEDGTMLKMQEPVEIKIESEVEHEKPLFPVNGSYELSVDINYPHCFLDYDRYLAYHFLGYDRYNVPFYRDNWK